MINISEILYLPVGSVLVAILPEDIKRFWQLVDKTDTCWLWTGCKHYKGYGHFMLHNHVVKAHRVAYTILYGPIVNNLQVLHTTDCVNKECVRHLYLGTPSDNNRDTKLSGKSGTTPQLGAAHAMSLLTTKQVLSIREKYATGLFTYLELSIEFEITFQHVGSIVTRKSWKHI